MKIAAVIFDMDGVLVDTEPLYKVAWQQGAAELGHTLDDDGYARMVGRPTEDCERILIEQLGPSFPLVSFQERWPAIWRDQVEQFGVPVKPGVVELIDFVARKRWPIAVATSSDADYAAFTLRRAGLDGRFPLVVSGDMVPRGKPAPDIYLEAARRVGSSPFDCVAFEDSEAGIQAVAAAGMTGVLVPHWPPSEAAIAAASRVIGSLHEGRAVLTALIDNA